MKMTSFDKYEKFEESTAEEKQVRGMLKSQLVGMVIAQRIIIRNLKDENRKEIRISNRIQSQLDKSMDDLSNARSILKAIKQSVITMIAVKHPKRIPKDGYAATVAGPEPEELPHSEEYEFLSYILKLMRKSSASDFSSGGQLINR